ncbi:MAG TPA: hypothetical protein VFX49_05615 [Chloroflexota bacterium]|nr:hypothetical protein [Chloroflexota bacterium]
MPPLNLDPWWIAAAVGAAVIVVVAFLLIMIAALTDDVSRHTAETWQVGSQIARNTAAIWQFEQTNATLGRILAALAAVSHTAESIDRRLAQGDPKDRT